MEAASQAADQVVRLTLEGVEYAIRLTGKTAVHTAALAAALGKLAAEKHTSKGAQRLAAMLKSGRELTVFSVPEQRLKEFAQEAKRYGVSNFFAKCSYALYNSPQEVHEYECNERRDPCSSRRSPSDEL